MRLHPRLSLAAASVLFLSLPALADKLDDDLAAAKNLLISGNSAAAAARLEALQNAARQAVAAKPDDAHANYILGMAAMYAGDDTLAARALDLAVRLEPKSAVYAIGRADLANFQDRPGDAALALQRFVAVDDKNAEAWDMLGAAQSEIKQYPAALQSFQKAVDLAPAEPKYVTRIAETLMAQGKEDDAVAAYEKALKVNPKYAIALTGLGDIQQRRKNYDKALDLFAQAVAGDAGDYRSIARQAQIFEATGKAKDRDAALEKVRALYKAGKIDSRSFCREQFSHGTSQVMGFEYMGQEKLDIGMVYGFVILKPDGKTVTQTVQLTIQNLNKNATTWRLSAEGDLGRQSLVTLNKAPSYEETRTLVTDYLDGKLKSQDASTLPARGTGAGGQ